jgi:hypothetical protein
MPEQRPEDRPPRNLLDRAARSTMGGESTAFGFSIMITATFGAIQVGHGSPSYGQLILFALCASLTFAVLEGFASRGYRESLPEYESFVQTPGTALNVLSVTAGVGAAIGLAAAIDGGVAWPTCPMRVTGPRMGFKRVTEEACPRDRLAPAYGRCAVALVGRLVHRARTHGRHTAGHSARGLSDSSSPVGRP